MVSVIFAVLEVSFWALTTVVKLPWKFLTLIKVMACFQFISAYHLMLHLMLQAYAVFDFVWNYALPVIIFAYCYARIFYVIRRHNKVVSGQVVGNEGVAMATMPRGQHAQQVDQQATEEAATGDKLSRTEVNVLQTMIAIILCFVLCWSPASIANIIQSLMVCLLLNIREKIIVFLYLF